jgi:hypothetical protein
MDPPSFLPEDTVGAILDAPSTEHALLMVDTDPVP